MKPGTLVLDSMKAITRFTVNAETMYKAVTPKSISMPLEVSSCACIANNVSSATDTAKATEEFLMMFMDSEVNGGITIRKAMGKSTKR